MKLLALALILLGTFSTAAEARHRQASPAHHPMCNITMPCDFSYGPAVFKEARRVARGERVVKAMRGFGAVRRHGDPIPSGRSVHKAADKMIENGNGVVKASTGEIAYVARGAAVAFQCVVDKLEAAGYRIKEMGGFANRGHIRGSLHYRGLALDVNQVERNVTVPKMPADEIQIANGCGLISGAQWRNADSGHFQLGGYDGRPVRVARHHRRHRMLIARRLE